ncbi:MULTISPECIES: RidA family protein [Providencia]|uniref:YjgF family putative translation initiation inhibitor n=1 Tax=Providencia heimbachae ATCC 35613 TaxID=1354272 RepID=A0A1B7JNS0_9GAMM|nr:MULTISPECIES: RidA family protein [Providencia]MBP6122131.1 RidA family protein [Providencia sp.]MDD9340250.1 RidA family protein [Providencia heimbachae]NIH21676.1 RidA family protein [Providencia heimbachae]OAT49563.1 YjgF family putative translation initiation inhibitor [Providencia heimbachae ATCC 35613]QCJ69222.1 RidA family protein [Providencia heimbachae]
MSIKRNNPKPRLADSVEYAGLVYLSGQVPSDLTGDITKQTEEVFAKIDALLAASNSDKTRILSAQVWIKDINRDFAAFNAVWESWMPVENSPARAAVEANMAREQVLVEVMVTAVQR